MKRSAVAKPLLQKTWNEPNRSADADEMYLVALHERVDGSRRHIEQFSGLANVQKWLIQEIGHFFEGVKHGFSLRRNDIERTAFREIAHKAQIGR